MTSDLFHDVARAYYGVSAELYTLANIATNGAAPEGYAMGCDAPQQYAGYAKPELPAPTRQPRSTRGQMGLFKDIDVSPEAKQSADVSGASQTEGGESSNVAKIIPGLEGILQPGDIQESLGEKWPEHVNHDEAWMSLDRERPDKSDTRAFRQWWDRNKRVNTYRKMMFHVMHPEHNPLEELDLKHTTGNGIAYSLSGPQSKPDFSETGTGGHVATDESAQPESKYAVAPPPPPPMPTSKPKYPATSVLKAPPPPPPMSKPTKPNFRETGTGTILPPPKMATPTGSTAPTKSPAETKGLADASARFVAKVRESTPEARAAEDRRWKALEAKWVEDVLKANHEPPVKMNHPLSRGLLPVV
jgi:hypothetical protein